MGDQRIWSSPVLDADDDLTTCPEEIDLSDAKPVEPKPFPVEVEEL